MDPKIKTTAESTGGFIVGVTTGICVAVALVMFTIKLGLVLFT